MRILLFLTMLIIALPLCAQQKSWLTKNIYSNNMRKMSNKGGLLCPVNEKSAYPLHGLGIKLGDPTALTYKFYANKNIAFTIDGGMAASNLYTRYYRSKFEEYAEPLIVDPDTQGLNYLGQNIGRDLFGEIKVLYSLDAGKIADGLLVYTGLGWQVRSTNLSYNFQILDFIAGDEITSLDVKRSTSGPSITLGIEYAYFEMPISAFMEMQVFFDSVLDPGWIRPQGGIGIRYIF